MLGVRNPLNFSSCVYVWVMNHLGVVFGDTFGLFWVFGWISGKMDKISKFGQFRGPKSWSRDPTQPRGREGDLDKPRVHRAVAKLRRGKGLHRNVAMLRRGVFLRNHAYSFFEPLRLGLLTLVFFNFYTHSIIHILTQPQYMSRGTY